MDNNSENKENRSVQRAGGVDEKLQRDGADREKYTKGPPPFV